MNATPEQVREQNGLGGRVDGLNWVRVLLALVVGLAVGLTMSALLGLHPGAAVGGAVSATLVSTVRNRRGRHGRRRSDTR